jgi:hypothetical protein
MNSRGFIKAREMKEKRKEKHNSAIAQRKRIEEDATKRCQQLIETCSFHLASRTAGISIHSPPTEALANFLSSRGGPGGVQKPCSQLF